MAADLLPAPDTGAEDVYHLYAMRYARARDRRVRENFLLHDYDAHDGPMPVDYNLWIIRNAHRTVVVDTGFGEASARDRKRILDFDPVDGLRRLGVDPDTVQDVILTHLHFDHAGNIDRFPAARFHLQDAEIAYATGRCMCHPYLRHPFTVDDVVAFVRTTYAGRVVFHDGDTAPFPGIELFSMPGHSMGLKSVRVKTIRGPVLLASDASHYFAQFLNRQPSRSTADMMATLATYARLRRLVDGLDRIVPGHDPKIGALYPHHVHGGVDLVALHEQPLPHVESDLADVLNFRTDY